MLDTMRYIESPENYTAELGERSIFLAGGITNCPNWQQEMVDLLRDAKLILINPRRANFPIGDPSAALEQITWEYVHLRKADAILFWFPHETICPIVLYELGTWSMTNKPIFVGVHPEYQRRQDVEIQTGLVRSDVEIVYSLQELARQVVLKLLKHPDNAVNSRQLHCCEIGCEKPAEWEIAWGVLSDNNTQACTDHVGILLEDGPKAFMVYRISAFFWPLKESE